MVLTGPGRAKVGLWVYGCHWTGFQETVISLWVWEASEASGFHQLKDRLLYVAAVLEGQAEEEGCILRPCEVLEPAEQQLHDD